MTLTKHNVVDRPFTTRDVLEQTGITFRMLDYWLRTGAVTLGDANTPGSGRNRRYTADELAAIRRVIARYKAAMAEIDAVRSGRAFTDELPTDGDSAVYSVHDPDTDRRTDPAH